MKQHLCQICREPFESFVKLKQHFADTHPDEWVKREQWLDNETRNRIRSYEELAADGMLGFKEQR